MPVRATSPVSALEQQIVSLEAALAVCRAEPREAAVHQFRSTSRRVEALLVLLSGQRGLPPFRVAAEKLNRELRKLRRSAGALRDHDVHLKLLRTRLGRLNEEDERRAAHKVIDSLFAARQSAANRFQKLLNNRETKVAARLEALRKALAPAADLRLPAAAYLTAADAYVRQHAHLPRSLPAGAKPTSEAWTHLSEDELHDVRKAAKLARYMLEPAPLTAHVRATGKRFHAVQNAGGHWHDALELARASRRLLGKNHTFTVALRESRNRYLAGFLRSLETLL